MGEFNEAVRVSAPGFPNDFAAFDGANLAKESQNELFGNAVIQIAHVQGFCAITVHLGCGSETIVSK